MSPTSSEPPVVVGTDGSEQARTAVRWAAREAAAQHAPLHIVHVIGLPIYFGSGTGYLPVDIDAARRAAREIVDTAIELAVEAGGADLTVAGSVLEAAPVPTLRDIAKDARLLVVGTRGMGALRRGLLGSVSTGLARHAECPVAVIPEGGGEPAAQLPVVVGVDGSACSEHAVRIAFEAASRHGCALIAVYAWTPFGYLSPQERQRDGEVELAESLAGYAEEFPEVPVERMVVEDNPARCLLALTEDARLVVVGSHGRGGFAGMTLGSVSQAVLHGAECPVIIAR